jgi:hypothetical protein
MKLSMKCATSLAALVLMAPVAIAQQPKEDRGGGASAAQKAPQNNAGGSERGLERSGDNRNEKAGQRGEERANESKSDVDARRSDSSNKKNEKAGSNNERAGEDSSKTRQDAKDGGSASEKASERRVREDRAGPEDNKSGKNGTVDNSGKKDDGERAKTAVDRDQKRSGDQAKDRADGVKERDRNSNQADADVKPEDRQKADQVRAKVDQKDRDRLREKAFQGDVRRASDANIRVNIGTRLPRRVEVYDLPLDIVELAPAYRGYRYVVVGDDYCIIDPETYVIVDVISRGGSGRGEHAYRSGGNEARLELTNDQIKIIRAEVNRGGRKFDYDGDLEVGVDLPDQFAFEDFPGPVVERVPSVRQYRFVRIEDEIAIVSPDNRQVIYVIGNE